MDRDLTSTWKERTESHIIVWRISRGGTSRIPSTACVAPLEATLLPPQKTTSLLSPYETSHDSCDLLDFCSAASLWREHCLSVAEPTFFDHLLFTFMFFVNSPGDLGDLCPTFHICWTQDVQKLVGHRLQPGGATSGSLWDESRCSSRQFAVGS